MDKTITLFSKNISYKDIGEGNTIVFLHGFLESKEIWKDFTEALSKKFRIISIDLPGHGKSDQIDEVHSMELMADRVNAVLEKEGVEKCFLIGHSMGGYVCLEFADKYTEKLKAFCLFHSHAAEDTDEIKKNRDRTIEIVKAGKQEFINMFIPDLFAEENVEKYQEEISFLQEKASETHKEGIIAALKGMKIRKDYCKELVETKLPVLFIVGQKDKRIDLELIKEQMCLPKDSEALIIENAGHMGHIEEKEMTLNSIIGFADRVF